MELEFDKEIDAILRKARGGPGTGVSTNGTHLDADTIAAFAEDALPQKTKLLYMEHLADCDRCRKQLSYAVMMGNEADAAAAVSVSTPAVEAAIPWHQKFFKTQNLALAMGALVLTFSGILAYLVLQDRQNNGNATVSQVTEQEPMRGGPYVGGDAEPANSNMAMAATTISNTTVPAANVPSAAINGGKSVGSSTSAAPGTAGRSEPAEEKPVTSAETGVTAGAGPPAAPPPPPFAVDGAIEQDGKPKDDDDREHKLEDNLELAKRKQAEVRAMTRRDAPPPAAKTGPARSGPVQMQSNQVNTGVFDMSVTRTVGGKSFNNRNGAWYDTAYNGQATRNYRRGTEDYKTLDRGLRNIADTLGGTVVVIWRSKAYRIQ